MAWDQNRRADSRQSAVDIRQKGQQIGEQKNARTQQGFNLGGTVLGGLLSLIPGVGPVVGGAVTAGMSGLGKAVTGDMGGAAQSGMSFISRLAKLENPYTDNGSGYGGGGPWSHQVGRGPY